MKKCEPLTIPDVHQLSVILNAASRSSRVRWLADDDVTVRSGTARHIVSGSEPHQWHFLPEGQDVRDSFLRITSTTGFDYAVPVRRLMHLVALGGFAVDD